MSSAVGGSDPAIIAESLTKIYKSRSGDVRALDGLDLVVDEGTVLALLGPNGAGKTTTVRILATLLRPDGGRASVLGHDVVKDAQRLRRVIGLSGQQPSAVGDGAPWCAKIRGRLRWGVVV